MAQDYDPKTDRLLVMKAIYEVLGDDTDSLAQLWPIREEQGLDDDRMANAVNYLEGEYLIKLLRTMTGQRTPMHANITHRGVREMEKAEANPEQPSTYFPPFVSVVHVGGNMIGSAIQSGSAGAAQHYQAGDIIVGEDTKKAIDNFVVAFEAQKNELEKEKSQEVVAELTAEVATIKAQINSPKPKKHFIKESLASARAVLEHGAGGVVTAGLLALIVLIFV